MRVYIRISKKFTNIECSVTVNAGANVLERNSIDSPIFINDQDGFRSLYSSINNALNQKEQFYIYEVNQLTHIFI